jgi:mono/diheme cytochrome c family protein
MHFKQRIMSRWARSAVLAVFICLVLSQVAAVSGEADSARAGKELFDANCSTCHSIGGGDIVGPDLQGVTQLYDEKWLVNFISAPSRLIANNDEHALKIFDQYNRILMPTLGLSHQQVLSVLAYLNDPSAASAGLPGGVAAPQPVAGNPDNGRDLFTNRVKLVNGGLACVDCHNIDAIGLLGGGAMGPDLTGAYAKYGDQGLAGALASIEFPTMKPLYADHPLTLGEQADLAAFIKSIDGQPRVNKEAWVLAASLAGFIGVMVIGVFYWRGRLRGVRRGLLDQALGRDR